MEVCDFSLVKVNWYISKYNAVLRADLVNIAILGQSDMLSDSAGRLLLQLQLTSRVRNFVDDSLQRRA